MKTFCSPEKEDCVKNQALKYKDCLVPCSGLYADIEDMSHVMKGIDVLEQIFLLVIFQVSTH